MSRAAMLPVLVVLGGCSLLVNPRAENEYDLRDAGPRDTGTQDPDAQVLPDSGVDAGPSIPAAPLLRFPWNGYMTGSVHTGALPAERNALRPRFVWESSPGAESYEIALASTCEAQTRDTCAFDGALVDATAATEWRPAEALPVSMSAPVGRRYVWRVRACNVAGCSGWTEVRYLDVGRQPTDFNGDGYSEVMVGAAFESSGLGNVYVFGGDDLAAPPRQLEGFIGAGVTPAGIGWLVAAVGDVDADGFPDAVVTALVEPSGGVAEAGRAYLLAGQAGPVALDLARPVVLESAHPTRLGLFGNAIGGGGDMDGDGYSDFAIGAPQEDVDAVSSAGRTYLYRGGAAVSLLDPPAVLVSPAPQPTGLFGASASVAGDLNGDGLVDLVIGAAGESGGGTSRAGRAYVLFGSSDRSVSEPSTLVSRSPTVMGGFGASVASGGDLNGDGLADLVVGAPGEGSGAAYVFTGNPAGVEHRATYAPSEAAANASIGVRVSTSGDVDGDGRRDLVLGAYRDSGGASESGAAFVVLGSADLATATPIRVVSPAAEADGWFGVSVALGTDVDGDGRAELTCGAFEAVGGQSTAGRVYLFDYDGGLAPRPSALTATSPSAGGVFGTIVADTTVTGSGFDPI